MTSEYVDVVIIGAGISGIGAGCHLTMKCPNHSFLMLEGRENIGGTWDLFRYPGIRSDSDMYTFGYKFRPWREKADIAPAQSILKYLNETVEEYGLRDKMRFGHRVSRLSWSSEDKMWTVIVKRNDTGEESRIRTSFVLSCTGYYRYDHGYLPKFEGYEDFKGEIIHPQHWPEDADYEGKNVTVIGSGATAITLVPALTDKAQHVTMIQRSPTYVFTRPAIDVIATWTHRLLPEKLAYKLMRIKNILLSWFIYSYSKRKPDKIRQFLRKMAKDELGDSVDVDVHFNPKYNPWDQRMCLIPDSDLFKALKSGKASIETDHIEKFTPTGVKLKSGKEIKADLIIPATGLELAVMQGVEMYIDDEKVDFSQRINYKGMMFSDVPNFLSIFGYTNASWTLKADLSAEYTCRLLNYLHKHSLQSAMPVANNKNMDQSPIVDLSASYFQRAFDKLPKQGPKPPWRNQDNYLRDRISIRYGKINDGVLQLQ